MDTLTPAEWIVMNALWEESPATLSEVIRRIGDKAEWNYKTFASYLAILSRKGLVGADKRLRDKLYYPLVTREACIEAESSSLVKKMGSGAVKELMVSMVRKSDLSLSEREELLIMMESLLEKGAK